MNGADKMMDREQLFQKIDKCVNDYRNMIIETGDHVYKNPETGYREFKTSRYMVEKFRELGLECITGDNIPAVKVTVDTGRPGPGVAILGEMDSVICSAHPDSDRETGAVHACGHNAQLAALIGACAGLVKSGVLENLSGKLHFMAVPAEEYIEISYRMDLREKGIIRYLGGKPELVSRGWFDDVDISMMIHAASEGMKVGIEESGNGCLAKMIRYIGKPSHAGGAPDKGINALYAATLGLSAINAIRETFEDYETIRVHPIITKGGDIVNVIPDDVRIETYVRGKSIESILETNKKVNRALVGGAVSMGARVEIVDIPGYMPLSTAKALSRRFENIARRFVDESEIRYTGHSRGSTDMGDLSTIMPIIQPYIGGFTGSLHSDDFAITDKETAYVLAGKLLACTAADLLYGDASAAREVLENFTPTFKSKKEYIDFMDSLYVKRVYPVNDPLG